MKNVQKRNTKETRAVNTKTGAKFNPKTHQSKSWGSPCPRRIGKIADYFSRIGVLTFNLYIGYCSQTGRDTYTCLTFCGQVKFQSNFFYSTFKLVHAAKTFTFLLQLLFRRNHNNFSNLNSILMKK